MGVEIMSRFLEKKCSSIYGFFN